MVDVEERSYRYLRVAIVGSLLAVAVAVFLERWRGTVLESVSSYYFTPAQGIFVGALIALGTCMVALRGVPVAEDVALNVGGALAMVVAVVPATRERDLDSVLEACTAGSTRVLTDRDGTCPAGDALRAALAENVRNNVTTLLVVTLAAIAVAALYLLRDARRPPAAVGALAVTAALWAAVTVWFAVGRDSFVAVAHYAAAGGLFVAILVVAGINARALGGTGRRVPRNRYSAIALLMVAVAVVGGVLTLLGVVTLFWLEIAVAAVFAVFWTVQTLEREGRGGRPIA